MSLVVGFGYVTSQSVDKSVGVVEGAVVFGSVVLVTASPLSCPGSGLGNLGDWDWFRPQGVTWGSGSWV